MTRNRIICLLSLAISPFAFLIGVGAYHLWVTDWLFWAWWPMLVCFAVTYVLGWRWQKQARREVAAEPPPFHYTDRDEAAWERVKDRIKNADMVTIDDLSGPHQYVEISQQMAEELAAIYYPNASDPIGKLTIPEMLTVIELAAHDLAEMSRTFLPGGHLVTIDNLRQAKQAVKWYKRANNVFWAFSAVLDPIRTGLRYGASRVGLGKPLQMFQDNVFLWFYSNFIRRLGHYLIELYSGRLKVGAQRYRELLEEHNQTQPAGAGATIVVDGSPTDGSGRAVTIAVIGQVKAGKSSLINALLGERRAVTDVIPATPDVSRYELHSDENSSKLIFLDTAGYNQSGPAADQFETTIEAAQNADIIFLVTHARNPARDADVKVWRQLREWFTDRPNLKMPPVLIVMTHIDLLSPSLEWAPPYDWRHPAKPKEKNISEAIDVVLEQFGDGIAAAVPVCTAETKLAGIKEELLPEMTVLLGEARAVAFLRCLHAEADDKRLQRVLDQLLAAGKALLFSSLSR